MRQFSDTLYIYSATLNLHYLFGESFLNNKRKLLHLRGENLIKACARNRVHRITQAGDKKNMIKAMLRKIGLTVGEKRERQE
jgi:hypothetical protein